MNTLCTTLRSKTSTLFTHALCVASIFTSARLSAQAPSTQPAHTAATTTLAAPVEHMAMLSPGEQNHFSVALPEGRIWTLELKNLPEDVAVQVDITAHSADSPALTSYRLTAETALCIGLVGGASYHIIVDEVGEENTCWMYYLSISSQETLNAEASTQNTLPTATPNMPWFGEAYYSTSPQEPAYIFPSSDEEEHLDEWNCPLETVESADIIALHTPH